MPTNNITELREDLRALDESIEHWIRMRDGTHAEDESLDSASCACCVLGTRRARKYGHANPDIDRCLYCPVYDVTRKSLCKGTPYTDAYDVLVPAGTRPSPESYYIIYRFDLARLSDKGRFESPVADEINFLQDVRAQVIIRLAKLEK